MKDTLGEILMNKKRLPIIIGIVIVVVALVVIFDTLLANHQPAIASLTAPERVVPSGGCQIVCNATDGDGDELSYNWSASAGELNGEGATVTWMAPDSVGSYNITVTVTDGRGEAITKQIIIEVRANRAPTITDLATDAGWTLPSGTVQLTCRASDPDGDELTYEWTADAGDISETGAAVNWTAPQETGIYYIMVVVMDSHGSSDIRTLSATVAQEQPPVIEELLVTAEHCYLKTYSSGYRVGKEQEYHIECIVSDSSSVVSYNWSCDDGEISGEGSRITWTAPNPPRSSDITVTVVVSDIAGNMASKDLALNVVNCSPCTFGC
jgi:hypothetical protein